MATRRGFNVVQNRWKEFLQELEGAQSRRWKSGTRQSSVQIVSIQENGVEAKVKWFSSGGSQRVFSVRVPVVSWWAPYRSEVVVWLARRPDWQAALLSRQWDEEFVDFVESAGLQMFPEPSYLAKLNAESVCSCSNPEIPCIHMMAVLEAIVREQEAEPHQSLELVGLPFDELLNDAHAVAAQWVRSEESLETTGTTGDWDNSKSQLKRRGEQDTSDSMSGNEAANLPNGLVPVWPQEVPLVKGMANSTALKAPNTQFPIKISEQQLQAWYTKLF